MAGPSSLSFSHMKLSPRADTDAGINSSTIPIIEMSAARTTLSIIKVSATWSKLSIINVSRYVSASDSGTELGTRIVGAGLGGAGGANKFVHDETQLIAII